MKKILLPLIIFFFLLVSPVKAATNSNLKFFGYMSPEGLINDMSPTYFEEMDDLKNSNTAWGHVKNLEEFYANNIQVVLTEPRWLFFSGNVLRSDWETQWNNYKKKLVGLEHTFYGFYFDEPFWRGYNPIDFETITKQIHTDFPDKAIMIIEAWPMFRDNKYTPTSDIVTHGLKYVTDIGLDFYFSRTENNSWDEYMSYYNNLKLVSGDRKIWLVPDGYSENQTEISRMKIAFDKYLNLAQTDSDVVGIFNFVYEVGTTQFSITLDEILQPGFSTYDPTFRQHQIAAGKAIIANNPMPTKTPTSTPTLIPTIIPTATSTPNTSLCTQCSNLPEAKSKGDADCSGITTINDISIWRTEFILGELGISEKTNWVADFDCDGKVSINDASIWRENFIKSL